MSCKGPFQPKRFCDSVTYSPALRLLLPTSPKVTLQTEEENLQGQSSFLPQLRSPGGDPALHWGGGQSPARELESILKEHPHAWCTSLSNWE